MREWTKPASTLLLGFGLGVFCLFVYLSHLPVNYTYDGMVFSARIENPDTPLYDLFHPHHLIYTLLGRLFFLWGKTHGADWDGLVSLQFFDILTGVLGILIVFHLLVRETNDRFISFLSALGLSFTFSYWYFSTSPGVRILATTTPLLAWYVLTYLKKAAPLTALLLGGVHALAVLGHQTNLLLIPAFLGGIWCMNNRAVWDRLKMSFYYLTVLSVSVLSAYVFVGRFVYFKKNYETWLWWVFAYFHVQAWGGYTQQTGFQQGKFAMLQAFLAKTRPEQTMAAPFTFETVQIIFLYAVLIILSFLILRVKFFWDHQRQLLWVGLLWIAAFVPFFIWWEPWNIEFWVSSTAPCWILMGAVASDISQRWKNPVLHFANRSIVILIWAGIMSLLFLYNFQENVKKSALSHGPKPILEAIDWKLNKDDLLVLTGINTIPLYIDRYQKRKYLNLHMFFKKYEEKPEKAGEPKSKLKEPLVKPDPWKDLAAVFQKVWKHHRKVWVMAEAEDENDPWYGKFERLMKFPGGQLSSFFHQYDLSPVSYKGNVYFYEMHKPVEVPTPTPTVEVTPVSSEMPVKRKKSKKS